MLLALSVTTQVLVVNRYRLDWAVQNQYYWQLHWRAPALEPGTAIVSFEQPSASVPGYDASFAMNVLFNGDARGGIMPYWFFTNDRFLNFELRPEKAISYKDRNLQFKGNTSAAIALIRQGENRCLQVLDAVYADQPFYGLNQEQLVGISNPSPNIATPGGSPEPRHLRRRTAQILVLLLPKGRPCSAIRRLGRDPETGAGSPPPWILGGLWP